MKCEEAEGALTYSEWLAFFGNSLLLPMNQTEQLGLQPAFWERVSRSGDTEIALAAERWIQTAAAILVSEGAEDAAVQRISVECTHLFIGPPRPAAPPWETYYRNGECKTGFGEPTFEVRRAMANCGLTCKGPQRQLEDHMGIELLLLSRLSCAGALDEAVVFAKEHPLAWIDGLIARVDAAEPQGYYGSLLRLAKAVMLDMIV